MPSVEPPTPMELPPAADVPLWDVIRTSTEVVAGPADVSLAARGPEAPPLVELIWSYWLEEGGLVRTMDAISLRFQNRRHATSEPLAGLRIDTLRPLGHLLWEYVQDEPRRLTVRRRAHEYEHEYGL